MIYKLCAVMCQLYLKFKKLVCLVLFGLGIIQEIGIFYGYDGNWREYIDHIYCRRRYYG